MKPLGATSNEMIEPDDLARAFAAEFGRPPRLFRAPGRVNLIGEHTDYNDGFVMPMAIDRDTWVAAAPRPDAALIVRSRERPDTVTVDLEHPAGSSTNGWGDYVRGVAAVLGVRRGADMLVWSDVPIGAGLSSSAALEVSVGYALLRLAGMPIDLTSLALACQRAEHEFAGTRCGMMDQMIACHGRAGQLLRLDTRTLDCEWVPLPDAVRVAVCNTMVSHALASAEYNARRADCEAGVQVLARRFGTVRALRDATEDQLESVAGEMPRRIHRRCRHVVTENQRVARAADALKAGDFQLMGRLMAESHRSLRDDYEVSCVELDAMTSIVSRVEGVYGARMTGGGFGGCVVALIDAQSDEERVRGQIQEQYEGEMHRRPDVWFCSAAAGVSAWTAAPAVTATRA